MLAVHEGYLTMVQILEQKGANVNLTDEDGDTALHMSLMREKFTSTGMGMVRKTMQYFAIQFHFNRIDF